MEKLNKKQMKKERAIVMLCSYESVSLDLALKALDETITKDETVVLILNGLRGIRSAKVELLARKWIKNNENRYVVIPLNYGKDAYNSIKEIIENFEPLKDKKYICKIDDDLIPLGKRWIENLHLEYIKREKNEKIGFITPLINNNTWGFAELVKIYNKEKEYKKIINYKSKSGTGEVEKGEIADGFCGTVWEYPYLARWCHEWTLLDINKYINKTKKLGTKEVSLDTHYSIGCIFFKKKLWSEIEELNKKNNFDERSIHQYCKENNLKKIVILNEPMGHLFYYIQRDANKDLIPKIAESLSKYFGNEEFLNYPRYSNEEIILMKLEEMTQKGIFKK